MPCNMHEWWLMGYFARFPSCLKTFIDSLTWSIVSALGCVASNLEISHLQCPTDLRSTCGPVLCSVVMLIYAMRKLTSCLIAHTTFLLFTASTQLWPPSAFPHLICIDASRVHFAVSKHLYFVMLQMVVMITTRYGCIDINEIYFHT